MYGIDESTLYRMLKSDVRGDLAGRGELLREGFLFPELSVEDGRPDARRPDFFRSGRYDVPDE